MIMSSLKQSLLALTLFASQAQAHEFWIEPEAYLVPAGDPIRAGFHVGQNFKAPSTFYIPSRSVRLSYLQPEGEVDIPSRMGARPAIELAEAPIGLITLVHETDDLTVTYREEGKFEAFVTHKNLETNDIAHPLPFIETYRRYAKSLVANGTSDGEDRLAGLRHELVALDNPFKVTGTIPLQVQLFYEGALRPDAQIELFEKNAEGKVEVTLHRTDENGIASLPIKPGHQYLVDAVVLEPLSDGEAVWYSHWASLTFAVPSLAGDAASE